jgi:glycosyltransferase involved in cell wall biosynthesis
MRSQMPRVSVIIPTSGSVKLLIRAIRSIQEQTYRDFEIIIVDDHKKVEEMGAAQKFFNSDARIKIYRVNRKNKEAHIGELLNFGISKANGELIARLDDDDFAASNRLALQVGKIEANYDLVGMQAVYISSSLQFLGVSSLPMTASHIREYSDIRNPFVHSTVMFTRKSFDFLGKYDETLPLAQDYDLWLRYIKNGKQVANLRQIGVFHTRGEQQITHFMSAKERKDNINRVQSRYLDVEIDRVGQSGCRFINRIHEQVQNISWSWEYAKEKKPCILLKVLYQLFVVNPIMAVLSLRNLRRKEFI